MVDICYDPSREFFENQYKVDSENDRMFMYLWYEKGDREIKSKFGQKFVKKGELPIEMVVKRISDSVGVRKDVIPSSTVHGIWDVTSLAKSLDKLYDKAKIDDYIRNECLTKRYRRSEVHMLPVDVITEKINKFLSGNSQELPKVALSTAQYQTAVETINAINSGNKVVLAELCARFGKTPWASAISMELDIPITVVSYYVGTVQASFSNDIKRFEQFKDIVHIDSKDFDYKVKVTNALNDGKKIFIYLSLAQGDFRQDRIDFIFGLPQKRMLIIDEADFGAHKPKQVTALKEAKKDDDIVLIMTGTNADRAISSWTVDHMLSITYFELLLSKAKFPPSVAQTGLVKFSEDVTRNLLYPGIACYQMNLVKMMEEFIKKHKADYGEFLDENNLPSFAKMAAYPQKAKGFWIHKLEALFRGFHDDPSVNISLQFKRDVTNLVSMMFLPGNISNESLVELGRIAQYEALTNYVVITMCGNNGFTGKNAEQRVRETIEQAKKDGKPVLILASCQGQRSFSIPEISEVFLAYDNGELGATIQKMSRALTPNTLEKVGRIVSLSFDPNRDDKFDSVLMETALNVAKRTDETDIKKVFKDVFRTIDIFTCTENGSVRVDEAAYIADALKRKGLFRAMGKTANISGLTDTIKEALKKGIITVARLNQVVAAQKGKTFDGLKALAKVANNQNNQKVSKKEEQDIRTIITGIIEHSDFLVYGTRSACITETMEKIDNDGLNGAPYKGYQNSVLTHFGIPWDVIKFLIVSDIISKDWVNIRLAWGREKDEFSR